MSLPAGAVIGILGGGQLGRMLASAAARLGFDVHIYCPDPRSPAARVAARHWQSAYDDADELAEFARACDVVTVEFENVPVAAAEACIATGTPFHPGTKALAVAQDRVEEKTFLEDCGIACAPWRRVDDLAGLRAAVAEIGNDAILKTRREGYDGKGQVRLSPGSDLGSAWSRLSGAACILEQRIAFELEMSAIAARTAAGEISVYDPSHNVHEGGILKRSTAPAPVSSEVRRAAQDAAARLAEALGYVGVLALELFVMPDGTLLANEFAPRVHNSGHWTPEACDTCQFENHIRAVVGWPLGPVTRRFDVEMENLLGPEALAAPEVLLAGGALTLYGKREARDGRKMGHRVRRLYPAAS